MLHYQRVTASYNTVVNMCNNAFQLKNTLPVLIGLNEIKRKKKKREKRQQIKDPHRRRFNVTRKWAMANYVDGQLCKWQLCWCIEFLYDLSITSVIYLQLILAWREGWGWIFKCPEANIWWVQSTDIFVWPVGGWVTGSVGFKRVFVNAQLFQNLCWRQWNNLKAAHV